MNTQSFKTVNDGNVNIFYRNLKKRKTFNLLFLPVLSVLVLLLSCKKSIQEEPGQNKFQASLSNQTSPADLSGAEESVPYERTLLVPCGNGGAGEEVTLTGALKIVEQIIYNNRGFTLNYHIVAQGVSGIGLTTGEKFQASGGNKGTITGEFGEDGQYTRIYMEQLRIIGQNTVFKVFYKTKITIARDGKITSSIEEETIDCNE